MLWLTGLPVSLWWGWGGVERTPVQWDEVPSAVPAVRFGDGRTRQPRPPAQTHHPRVEPDIEPILRRLGRVPSGSQVHPLWLPDGRPGWRLHATVDGLTWDLWLDSTGGVVRGRQVSCTASAQVFADNQATVTLAL